MPVPEGWTALPRDPSLQSSTTLRSRRWGPSNAALASAGRSAIAVPRLGRGGREPDSLGLGLLLRCSIGFSAPGGLGRESALMSHNALQPRPSGLEPDPGDFMGRTCVRRGHDASSPRVPHGDDWLTAGRPRGLLVMSGGALIRPRRSGLVVGDPEFQAFALGLVPPDRGRGASRPADPVPFDLRSFARGDRPGGPGRRLVAEDEGGASEYGSGRRRHVGSATYRLVRRPRRGRPNRPGRARPRRPDRAGARIAGRRGAGNDRMERADLDYLGWACVPPWASDADDARHGLLAGRSG